MDFTTTPKQDLKYASESISQSIALGVDKLSHYTTKLGELLPDILRGLKGSSSLGRMPSIAQLTSDQKAFLKLIDQHSYLELRELKAYVPEGFTGTFIELLKALDVATDRCTRFQAEVLNPYVVFLAHLTSSGDALRSVDSHEAKNTQLMESRDAFYAAYSELHTNPEPDARRKLGMVVGRNADWAPILNQTNVLLSKLQGIHRDQIDQHVRQAEDYLEIIYHKLENGQQWDANPEVCKALADGAYQIGCELEFFSATYFWVLGLKGSIENTMAEVTRVLSR